VAFGARRLIQVEKDLKFSQTFLPSAGTVRSIEFNADFGPQRVAFGVWRTDPSSGSISYHGAWTTLTGTGAPLTFKLVPPIVTNGSEEVTFSFYVIDDPTIVAPPYDIQIFSDPCTATNGIVKYWEGRPIQVVARYPCESFDVTLFGEFE
jgi:hypothetical protein